MTITQAYRFALDPTPAQRRALASHAGAARFAWNWGLAACIDCYGAEGRWWSGAELHRLWNATKKTDPALGWWGENSKCVYQEAFRDLDRAPREFVRSRNGARKGRRLGYPRFKKRGRCREAFRFSTGAIRCAGRTVTLPRFRAWARSARMIPLANWPAGWRTAPSAGETGTAAGQPAAAWNSASNRTRVT